MKSWLRILVPGILVSSFGLILPYVPQLPALQWLGNARHSMLSPRVAVEVAPPVVDIGAVFPGNAGESVFRIKNCSKVPLEVVLGPRS